MQPIPVVSTGQPVIFQNAPTVIHHQPRQQMVAVKETTAMGILQIIIGIISVILGVIGIIFLDYYAVYVAYPIWAGVWIAVTGVLGVCSAKNPTNGCLNGTHMGFNIVSCLIAFIDFVAYAIAVAHYRDYGSCSGYITDCYYRYPKNHKGGLAIFSILLIAMLAEFIIALTASIYCCKAGCGCCSTTTQGVILQPAMHPGIVQPGVVQPVVSQVSYVQAGNMVQGQVPVVYSSAPPGSYPVQGYVQQQPYYTSVGAQMAAPAQTTMAYSTAQPAVAYSSAGASKAEEGGYEIPVAQASQPPPAYS